jgi:hypothetical protein
MLDGPLFLAREKAPSVSAEIMPVARREHVVQFYMSDAELVERAGSHLADAVRSGAIAIALAAPAHRRAFAAWMSASGVDVQAAEAEGTYLALDARETLQRFLVDGSPHSDQFDEVIGELVRTAAATGRPVCAYGEMVALLWDDGRVNAAIELESLWNSLGDRVPFSLFCSYPSTSVTGANRAEQFHQVCCMHTAVVGERPPRRSSRAFSATPEAPRASRHFVIETLRGVVSDDLVGDAALIITELATNAVVHARSDFTVAIAMSGGSIRIEVRDASTAAPVARTMSLLSASGRGLALVDAIASAWGSDHSGDGKVVWAELSPTTIAPA